MHANTSRRGWMCSPVVFAMMLLCAVSDAHTQMRSPVEERGFSRPTSYGELQEFLTRAAATPGITVTSIARTSKNRDVSLVTITSSPVFGSDTTKLRVLLFAQQHGDEPSGKEAMTMLIARAVSGELRSLLQKIDLLLIPQMNPDGAELRQRRTAEGIDLNRNHVLLSSPETKALHDVYHLWLPEVTVDVHEYGSFSEEWSNAGFIKTGDVQLGMLTNLNTSPATYALQHEQIFPFIATRMKQRGFSFHEYIVGTPQEYIRHSTTEVNDGRQSFGILGSVSFIQEGRKWRSLEDQLERRARSQLAALEALLDFCTENARTLKRHVAQERNRLRQSAGALVPIRMDHVADSKVMEIPVQMVGTGRDTVWRVHPYRSKVELLKAVILPSAYIVERKDSAVLALLARHHIAIETVTRDSTIVATQYITDSVGTTVIEGDTLPLLHTTAETAAVRLKPGDALIPTAQLQSRLIALLLEPESQWGLTKYEQFAYLRQEKRYPFIRIE